MYAAMPDATCLVCRAEPTGRSKQTIGFNVAETTMMHCTDANTGELMPVEAGVSFGSGADVIAAVSAK
jgi:hypothetical protein